MLFSIIIPVYNVEDYLEQCIGSVLSQEYGDYEMILVDDGSTDKSGQICDCYARKDERVKVIHQINRGLSAARNVGLDHSNGDYVIFIDSDDWIEKGCLQDLAIVACDMNPDLIVTTLTEAYQETCVNPDSGLQEYIFNGFTQEQAIDWITKRAHSMWPAPQYVYLRKMIEDNHVRFKEGFLQEDVDWTARICTYANCYAAYPTPWYNYRQKREGSISTKIRAGFITDIIDIIKCDEVFFRESKNKFAMCLFNKMVEDMYYSINMYHRCGKDDRKKIESHLEKNKDVLRYTPGIKFWAFSVACRTIGVKFALRYLTRQYN